MEGEGKENLRQKIIKFKKKNKNKNKNTLQLDFTAEYSSRFKYFRRI